MLIKQYVKKFALCLFIGLISVVAVPSQTTDFTYQGRLTSSSLPANSVYEIEFKLYDALTGGSLLGTRMREVMVTSGIFTVQLDFPPSLFDGANRFLEIGVRPGGNPNPFTVLSPRQPITSAPYSLRSLNTSQLGGIDANQYVLTTDPRMTDARNPLPNSTNYVQNTTSQQSSSNFNISGNGTAGGTLSANTVNAATQFNIGGNRILSNPGTANLFAGVGAGAVTTGINNSFFGRNAGNDNTTGNGNSFFGNSAGVNSTTGSANSFFGNSSGSANSTGASNTFIGNAAGNTNTTGSNNTVIGANADVDMNNLSFATAIGAGAIAILSNSISLGRVTGQDDVYAFGNLDVSGNLFVNGTLGIGTLGSGGTVNLCRPILFPLIVSSCSSSLRYKTDVQAFIGGLDVVRRLRPITFNWKDGGMRDVGFAAEDVEKVESLLVTYNDKGEIEGVKYGQLTTVLVNAVKEQQEQIQKQNAQIEAQQKQIQQQQNLIDGLRKIVCQQNPQAEICKEKQP
jgi:hypothetical protein